MCNSSKINSKYKNCCSEKSDKRIILKSKRNKKVKFIGINNERKIFLQIDLDKFKEIENWKGLITDYILIDDEKNNHFYIELKGQNIKHAIEQIKASIKDVRPNIINIDMSDDNYAFIIATAIPKQTKIQREKQKFKKDFKVILQIKTNQQKFDINKLKQL